MDSVLLLNQSHTNNIGDIAIGKSMESWAQDNGWNPITRPFWDEQAVFGHFAYTLISLIIKTVPFLSNWIIGKWVEKTVDAVTQTTPIRFAIIGGGELFCSHRGFNAVFSCWVNALTARGIPCCVIGVSGDERLGPMQIRRNAKALQKCFFVAVRDHNSQKIFEKLYSIHATVSPDVVFLLGRNDDASVKRDTVLCVPLSINTKKGRRKDNYNLDFYYHLVERMRCGKRVVFTVTEQRDQDFTESLCKRINTTYDADYEFAPYLEYDGFREMLCSSSIVISGRMHALILGLLCGCEIKAVLIKQKLRVFDDEYGKCDDIEAVVITARKSFSRYAEIIRRYIGE